MVTTMTPRKRRSVYVFSPRDIETASRRVDHAVVQPLRCVGGCRIRDGSVNRRSVGESPFIVPMIFTFCTLEFVLLWCFF